MNTGHWIVDIVHTHLVSLLFFCFCFVFSFFLGGGVVTICLIRVNCPFNKVINNFDCWHKLYISFSIHNAVLSTAGLTFCNQIG